MKRLEIFALFLFLAALWGAYFFIRHSYVIVPLAGILGVMVAAMFVACLIAFVAYRFRSKSS
jgi:hypothetical protein